MDDPGNLIYLVLALLSLIGGIWQNRDKKKSPSRQPEPVVIEHEPVARERASVQTVPDMTDAKDRLAEMREAAARARQSRRIKRRTRSLEVEEVSNPTTTHGFNLEDFDAKKAIIYSEILNPPYL